MLKVNCMIAFSIVFLIQLRNLWEGCRFALSTLTYSNDCERFVHWLVYIFFQSDWFIWEGIFFLLNSNFLFLRLNNFTSIWVGFLFNTWLWLFVLQEGLFQSFLFNFFPNHCFVEVPKLILIIVQHIKVSLRFWFILEFFVKLFKQFLILSIKTRFLTKTQRVLVTWV